MNNDIQRIIGSAFMDDFGAYCKELVKAGYDLNQLYSASDMHWGNFNKVLIRVAVLRGARSYDEYVNWMAIAKPPDHKPVSKQLFARVTGIYTPRTNTTQTDRTRLYRQRRAQELNNLRELTAIDWIANNLDKAREYIANLTDDKQ